MLLKAVLAAAGQLTFRKTTLNLYYFVDADNEKAVDNFNLRTEDVFTDVFTDKEDSGRGIITVSQKKTQLSSILVIVASYLIFQINICKFVLHEQLI